MSEIRALTMRELQVLLHAIHERRTRDASFQASLHGAEIKNPRTGLGSRRELNQAQEKIMDLELERIMSERRKGGHFGRG